MTWWGWILTVLGVFWIVTTGWLLARLGWYWAHCRFEDPWSIYPCERLRWHRGNHRRGAHEWRRV